MTPSIPHAREPLVQCSARRGRAHAVAGLSVVLVAVLSGCGAPTSPSSQGTVAVVQGAPPSCAVALLEHRGEAAADERIRRYQARVRNDGEGSAVRRAAWLERLGWAYVDGARLGQDPGLLTQAEHAAECLRGLPGPGPRGSGELLLGHVRHQQHRFADAERLARHLVATRGHWTDQALLGDVLLDRGDLAGARAAYQRLADLRPGPQAYQRAGELRWMLGDVRGAEQMLSRALSSLQTADPAPLAAVAVRLAALQWQLGEHVAATRTLDALDSVHSEFAPAQHLRGRMLLGAGQAESAIPLLRAAAATTEWPSHRWALIEALRSAGQGQAAQAEEVLLLRSAEDPRSRALYMATQQGDVMLAQQLLEEELSTRRDPLTLAGAAFAALQAGDLASAARHQGESVTYGPRDGRVCLHGALVSERLLRRQQLAEQMACVREYEHTLLPSEHALFDRLVTTQAVAREAINTNRYPSS